MQPSLAAGVEQPEEGTQTISTGWAAGLQKAFTNLFPGYSAANPAPAPGLGAVTRAERYSGPASTTDAVESPIAKEAKRAKKNEDLDRDRELARYSDDNVAGVKEPPTGSPPLL
ncbi:MAG: hypothetical protein WDW36_009086 [Sanguina aurantia]